MSCVEGWSCVDCEVSVLLSACVGVTCYQQSKTTYDFTQTIRFGVVIICVAHNAGATANFLRQFLVKTVPGLSDDNANTCAERLEEFAQK